MARQDTEFFSNLANCYAYAAKCATPTNAHATRQAKPAGEVPSLVGLPYLTRLRAGVITDANGNAQELGHFGVATLTTAQIPTPRVNWYLIAMLVHANGFHFVRRQQSRTAGDPFWKWKQGNPGLVERDAFDATATNCIGADGKWVRVTNDNFPDLVKNRMGTQGPGYGGWQTITFFEVHPNGFMVTAS